MCRTPSSPRDNSRCIVDLARPRVPSIVNGVPCRLQDAISDILVWEPGTFLVTTLWELKLWWERGPRENHIKCWEPQGACVHWLRLWLWWTSRRSIRMPSDGTLDYITASKLVTRCLWADRVYYRQRINSQSVADMRILNPASSSQRSSDLPTLPSVALSDSSSRQDTYRCCVNQHL